MSDGVIKVGATRLPILRRLDLRTLRSPVLVAIAYFIGAEVAFFVGTLSDKIFAPFWPPNVILFCALLLVPERRWWLYVAAVFPPHVVAELQVGMPAAQLLVAFVTNCMVAIMNAFAVRRLIGDAPWFDNLRKAALYVLITAGVSPAVVALGGAFVPILGGGSVDKYELFWTYWFISNALSSLTLGPVFLTWLSESPHASGLASWRRKLEAGALGVGLVVICTLAFEGSHGTVASGFLPALLYSPLPLILWATLRFGARGGSTAILIVTVVLTWRTLQGPSLFIGADPETNVLALQVFLAGLSMPIVLLGAAIDDVRHAEQRMRQLAGSVLTAQDEERRRIARELHDSTGQNLIAAGMLVGQMRQMLPDAGGPPGQQLDEMVQRSINELRTMSYLLHPPLLDEGGLRLALEHYLEGFSERSGVAVVLEQFPKLERVSSDIELVLFRVVQEALTNVARHSGSRTARIGLGRKVVRGRRCIVLSVEDTGRGLPVRRLALQRKTIPGNGVGLASMRERLNQVDGWLELQSGAGGTTLTAVVPLNGSGEEVH
jgi:signal transduction histidine kinase